MRRLVSILVPAYNAARFLGPLCRSIQAQTYADFEVLIGDDGSNDNTPEILNPFRSDSRFRIYRWEKNRGVTAATVELFGLMRGEYWCYPGADDVLHPEFLVRRVNRLEAAPRAAMIHGAAELIDEGGKLLDSPFVLELPAQMSGKRALQALLQHNFINTPSVMVRTKLTRQVLLSFSGNWNYAQDWFLWLLHVAGDQDLLWDGAPLHQYRVHSGSLSVSPDKDAVRRAEVRLVPLCALKAAAKHSNYAEQLWRQWRKALYALWLLRAFSLRQRRALRPSWLIDGSTAFYMESKKEVLLSAELFRHSLDMLKTLRNEKRAIGRQRFRVSGLAQIDDPIFR